VTAELYWSEAALAQLAAIAEHIGATSPVYAERVVDRLTLRCEQAQRLPLSGRSVPEYDRQEVRELIEPPYRIMYRTSPDRITVLAVVHGRQNLLGG
jgi:plasmid stabilization system protein ParE